MLVDPTAVLWIDAIIGRNDPLWSDDVGRAFAWIGATWRTALASVGVEADVYDGPLQGGAVGRTVCFAGLGPGELTVDGQKVVGISQRRTRDAARFLCACNLDWDPARLVRLLAPSVPAADVSTVAVAAAAVSVERDELIEAFRAALPVA